MNEIKAEGAHEVIEASFQTPEEVRVGRLCNISNRAVWQNQGVTDNSVKTKTILVGLVRVPYWPSISLQSDGKPSRNTPPPSARPPTPTCQAKGLSVSTEGVVTSTYPSHTPTKNDDTVVLEPIIDGIPDQAGPDHGGAG